MSDRLTLMQALAKENLPVSELSKRFDVSLIAELSRLGIMQQDRQSPYRCSLTEHGTRCYLQLLEDHRCEQLQSRLDTVSAELTATKAALGAAKQEIKVMHDSIPKEVNNNHNGNSQLQKRPKPKISFIYKVLGIIGTAILTQVGSSFPKVLHKLGDFFKWFADFISK